MNLQEDWDVFFQQRPDGGPWDVENNYNPDISVINFVREYGIPSTARVLDAGCGDGRNAKYLTSRKESVTLQGYILSSHTDPVRILSQHSLFSALPGVYPGFVCDNILNYLRGRRISLVAYK